MYLDKIIKVMKNDYPLIYNLKDYGFTDQLSEDELIFILSGIFGEPVTKQGRRNHSIYNQNGNVIYRENSNGFWSKREYDDNGNEIYSEDSDGYWGKSEYGQNGKVIYFENSDGNWEKYEYDNNGNRIYYENSDGKIYDNR